jgi:hypothetical protein
MRAVLGIIVVLAACSGGDGGDPCEVTIQTTPRSPRIGDTVRATATFDQTGVFDYTWQVTFEGDDIPFTSAAADGSAIEFRPQTDGSYIIDVDISGCTGTTFVEVGESNVAGEIVLRPHADYGLAPETYPLSLIPDSDKDLAVITVGPGRTISGTVMIGGTNEAAFIRFPLGTSTPPTPMLETFTDINGAFDVPIGPDSQTMIVVPVSPGIPWHTFSTSSGPIFGLTTGTALSGTVRAPNGALLAGARVQIIDEIGAATTVGTTDGSGAFTVNTWRTGTFPGTVTVTPPAASGLPRLSGATSFGAATIDIRYSATLVMRNAGGTQVTRSGPLANAGVTIVGTIPGAGTVTAANGEQDLGGTVRIATTTTGAGQLPAIQVPAAALSAVISPSAGDFAVAPFTTTTAVPASISAPAMLAFSTRVVDFQGGDLPGTLIALEPTGALAQAGAPTVTVTAGSDAFAAGALAAGGSYRVRASDPEGEAGVLIENDVAANELGSFLQLPKGLKVTGAFAEFGSTMRLMNSVVEIYCTGCSQDPAAAPLAQGVTDAQGRFTLTVPDPGGE